MWNREITNVIAPHLSAINFDQNHQKMTFNAKITENFTRFSNFRAVGKTVGWYRCVLVSQIRYICNICIII